jgi:signal transduction histidine kinase
MRVSPLHLFLLALACCNTTSLFSEELFSEALFPVGQIQEYSDVLTILAIEDNSPLSFQLPDGTPTGLYVEFWELWSEKNAIPINIVMAEWEDSLQMVRQKNMLLSGLFRSEQRDQWLDFSLPVHSIQTGIIYNRSTSSKSKLREQRDIKIASQYLSFQDSYIKRNFPEFEHSTYRSFDDAVQLLLDDKVQAIITELPWAFGALAKKGLTGVFTVSEEVILTNGVFGAIAKSQPELLTKINAGIENIPVNEIIALEKKWLPTFEPFFSINASLASLTLAERAWLQQHPNLRVGVDPGWYPYEYIDANDDFGGISADYIHYIEDSLSLTIEADKSYSWVESLAAIEVNKIDIMSAIVRTPEREKTMLFTEPYISEATVLVSRRNGFNAYTLDSLRGKSIGVPAGFAQAEFIATDYPEINIVTVKSPIDGLKKLSAGQFDAFVGSITAVNFNINNEELFDLTITGFSPYSLEVAMAVRTELAPLVGILNKVFLDMSEKDKASIANNWLSIQVKTGTDLATVVAWVLPIIVFLVLIIFVFVRMNRRLKMEIYGRKKSEKEQVILASQLHESQKMEALGKLTGGIAHDFNNMLGVILGYSELIKTAPSIEEKLASYAGKILDAGERGAKLTSKLSSFSRKHHIEAVQVDINEVLRDQQDILQTTLTVRVKITLQLCDQVSAVWLDRGDLEDAILNMSINAMHAMRGNLLLAELILSTENVVLPKQRAKELGLGKGNYVKFCIIDNGSGMSEEVSKKIFDPFYTTKGEEGTGLGLSQVFGFVQRSGGVIVVTTSPKKGAQFALYFPQYIVKTKQAPVAFEKEARSLRGTETILIVDDELALCQLAGELLQTEGYKVLLADSGMSALTILENEHIDLVLSDVLMPGLDGYQLATKIQKSYPKAKIQLVSGFADEKNNDHVDAQLQQNLINKPYSRIALLQGVRALLDS